MSVRPRKKIEASVSLNRAYQVILSPLVTEKSTQMSEHNKIVFSVPLNASKLDVKSSIEKIFSRNNDNYIKYLILGEVKLNGKVWGDAKKDFSKSIEILPTKRAYEALIDIEKNTQGNPIELSKLERFLSKAKDNTKWSCEACNSIQENYNIFCDNCKKFNSLVWKGENDRKLYVQNELSNDAFRLLS